MRWLLSFILVFGALCLQGDPAIAKPLKRTARAQPVQAPKPVISPDPQVEAPQYSPPASNSTALPKWEARTSPVAFLVGWLTIELGHRLSEQLAIGPSAIIYAGSKRPFLVGFRGHAIGFFGTYYFRALPKGGLYATARYYHEKYTSYPSPDSSPQVVRDIKGHSGTALLGYHLPFSKSLFALLGLGGQIQIYDRVNTQGTLVTADKKTRLVPYLEAKVGLAF